MFCAFSHDGSRFATAGEAGFQIFSLPPVAPFKRLRSDNPLGGISRVSLLGETPLVVIVGSGTGSAGSGTDRYLQLYDVSAKEPLTEMHFQDPQRAP